MRSRGAARAAPDPLLAIVARVQVAADRSVATGRAVVVQVPGGSGVYARVIDQLPEPVGSGCYFVEPGGPWSRGEPLIVLTSQPDLAVLFRQLHLLGVAFTGEADLGAAISQGPDDGGLD